MTNLERTLIEQARLSLISIKEIYYDISEETISINSNERINLNYSAVRTITLLATIPDSGLSDEARIELIAINKEVEEINKVTKTL